MNMKKHLKSKFISRSAGWLKLFKVTVSTYVFVIAVDAEIDITSALRIFSVLTWY
jgi:hypothetical protein